MWQALGPRRCRVGRRQLPYLGGAIFLRDIFGDPARVILSDFAVTDFLPTTTARYVRRKRTSTEPEQATLYRINQPSNSTDLAFDFITEARGLSETRSSLASEVVRDDCITKLPLPSL
jgi:hypothetical protein